MNPDLLSALQDYGLSQKESSVYLATLMLGESKVFDIATKASLLRETTYSILNGLVEKDLMSVCHRGNVKFYAASSPQTLIHLLKQKESKLTSYLSLFEDIAKNQSVKTKMHYYEGIEGLKVIFREIIRSENSTIYAFVNGRFVLDILPIFSKNILQKRIAQNISSRLLIDDSAVSAEFLPTDKAALRESRCAPLVKELNIALYLFDDALAILSLDKHDPMGILIENKNIYDALLVFHTAFWNQSKVV